MHQLLIEPAIVPDIFCTGLAEAEDLGDGNFRFTLYAKQRSFHDYAGTVDLVIVARLIMPAGAVMEAIQMTMKAMGVACCGGERLKLRH
ncbi:hypothetical protein CIT31_16750 [Mesorhizobium wenxiniae]|uniref:Uncharacterized protein n=1 Tax=Mesorhizobium wenxiniae TaxID=2014805 RepID=A0A271KG60_9HYPH|nr:hypothetical protein CIT31_16750 [Mesorhizobium wenxiniae]